MLHTLSRHLRQNAVAWLAPFVALGGTGAYAANTIGSTDIIERRTRRCTPVLVVLMFVIAVWPSGAAAGGRPSYYQPPTPYTDHVVVDDICEGFVTEIQFDGVDSLRNVRGSDGQAFLLTDVYTRHEDWTNSATGRTFTIDADATVKETSAQRVPKRKVPAELIPEEGLVGPIYRFRTLLIGEPFTLRDQRGRVLIHERGLVVFASLFDTLGDHAPGGTMLSSEPVRIKGPHPTLEDDFDLCAFAEKITQKP